MSATVHFHYLEPGIPEMQSDGSVAQTAPTVVAREGMKLDHVPPNGAHLWRAAPDDDHDHWVVTDQSWVLVGPTDVNVAGKDERWGYPIVDVYLARSYGPNVDDGHEESS